MQKFWKIWFVIIGCLGMTQAEGQGYNLNQTVRKGVIYKRERSYSLALQNHGFFAGMNFGRIRSYYKTNWTHWDIGMMRHPKETKVSNDGAGSGLALGSFIYGKQNSLFLARFGKGQLIYFSEKARSKGVAVGISMEAGASLAMLKPYYIVVLDEHDGTLATKEIKFSEETEHEFLDINHIQGASSFWKGMLESRFVPGAFGRIAVKIDPGAFEKMVKSLDIGIQLDAFTKRLPILATDSNKQFFLNFYAQIQFGKRYTKSNP